MVGRCQYDGASTPNAPFLHAHIHISFCTLSPVSTSLHYSWFGVGMVITCFQPLPLSVLLPPPNPSVSHTDPHSRCSRGLSCVSQHYHWSSSIMVLPGKAKMCWYCNHWYYALSDSARRAGNKEISLSVSARLKAGQDQRVHIVLLRCRLKTLTRKEQMLPWCQIWPVGINVNEIPNGGSRLRASWVRQKNRLDCGPRGFGLQPPHALTWRRDVLNPKSLICLNHCFIFKV